MNETIFDLPRKTPFTFTICAPHGHCKYIYIYISDLTWLRFMLCLYDTTNNNFTYHSQFYVYNTYRYRVHFSRIDDDGNDIHSHCIGMCFVYACMYCTYCVHLLRTKVMNSPLSLMSHLISLN